MFQADPLLVLNSKPASEKDHPPSVTGPSHQRGDRPPPARFRSRLSGELSKFQLHCLPCHSVPTVSGRDVAGHRVFQVDHASDDARSSARGTEQIVLGCTSDASNGLMERDVRNSSGESSQVFGIEVGLCFLRSPSFQEYHKEGCGSLSSWGWITQSSALTKKGLFSKDTTRVLAAAPLLLSSTPRRLDQRFIVFFTETLAAFMTLLDTGIDWGWAGGCPKAMSGITLWPVGAMNLFLVHKSSKVDA